VGANRGDFVKAGKYLIPNLKIHAFEPVPNIFRFKKAKFYNIGLSNKKEIKSFYINKINPAWSTFHKPIQKHPPDFQSIDTFSKRDMKVDRFDNLDIDIEGPCFLKIDTEGHEYEVLEGFGDRLKEVDFIQIEHTFRNYFSEKKKLSEVINLLDKYGFNGIVQLNLRYGGGKLTFCDFLFFRIRN
jgi:FkbM family methyltransferase